MSTPSFLSCGIALSTLLVSGQRTEENSASVCPLVVIDWKREFQWPATSEMELTVRNHSQIGLFFIATYEPSYFQTDMQTVPTGPYNGVSFSGRTYGPTPLKLPPIMVFEITPGQTISLKRSIKPHRPDFVIEFGLIAKSKKESCARLRVINGTGMYLHDSALMDVQTLELWVQAGKDAGRGVFAINSELGAPD